MKPELKQQLLEALKQTAQALAWDAFGECRGYHDRLPHPTEALALAMEAIAAAGADIAKHCTCDASVNHWCCEEHSPPCKSDIAKPVEPAAWMMRWTGHSPSFTDDPTDYLGQERELLIPLYTTPQEPAPRTPYGWQVQGLRDTYKGEFAEMDAKAEAARVGGTAYAFPIYIDPPI